MKVILLQSVARVGQKYDVKDVPDGYALNFLIPKRLAEPATPQNLKRLEKTQGQRSAEQASQDESFREALAKLADAAITMECAANEQGHLFQGVHAEDVVKHVAEQGIVLETEQVQLKDAIKEVGEHTIEVIHGEEKGLFTLTITPKAA